MEFVLNEVLLEAFLAGGEETTTVGEASVFDQALAEVALQRRWHAEFRLGFDPLFLLCKPLLHYIDLFLEPGKKLAFLVDRDLFDYLPEDLVPRLEEVLLVDAEIPLPEVLLGHALALIGVERRVIVRWTILDPVAALAASVTCVAWRRLARLRSHASSLQASPAAITPNCPTALAFRALHAHLVQVLL